MYDKIGLVKALRSRPFCLTFEDAKFVADYAQQHGQADWGLITVTYTAVPGKDIPGRAYTLTDEANPPQIYSTAITGPLAAEIESLTCLDAIQSDRLAGGLLNADNGGDALLHSASAFAYDELSLPMFSAHVRDAIILAGLGDLLSPDA